MDNRVIYRSTSEKFWAWLSCILGLHSRTSKAVDRLQVWYCNACGKTLEIRKEIEIRLP